MDRLSVEAITLIAESEGGSLVVKDLAQQLLNTMRENERLLKVIETAYDARGDQGEVLEPLMKCLEQRSKHTEKVYPDINISMTSQFSLSNCFECGEFREHGHVCTKTPEKE